MKKILSLFFAFLIFPNLISPNTSFSYDDSDTDFVDVDQNYPYFSNVNALHSFGVVEGYDDGTFRPNNTINRAEFLKIIMEYSNTETGGNNCFKDVKDEWFAEYICSAYKNGFVDGHEDGNFRPQDDISFVEASKILSTVLGIALDESENEIWYWEYVKALEDKNAIPFSITGFSHKVTRGEMAEIAVNARSFSTTYQRSLTYDDLVNINDLPQKENFAYRFKEITGDELEVSGMPDGVDSHTFQRISWTIQGLYRDANKIYNYLADGDDSELIVLEKADAETFQVLESMDYEIAFDKNHVYLRNKETSLYQAVADVKEGMNIVYNNIFTEGEAVYYLDVYTGEFIKMDGVDGVTFGKYSSPLKGMFEDKNNLYVYKFPALIQFNLDKESFEIVYPSYGGFSSGDWIVLKDKNGVYYSWNDVEGLKPFDGADPDTFEIMYIGDEVGSKYYGFYMGITAHDENSFYTVDSQGNLTKNNDIDVETYEEIVTQGEGFESVINYVKDKNKVYSASDLIPISWADPDTFEAYGYEYGFFMDSSNFIYGKSGDDFWALNYQEGVEEIMSDVDFETFEIMSSVEFKVYEEESIDTETYYYEDSGVCDLIEEDYAAMYEYNEDPDQHLELYDDGTCSIVKEYVSDAGYNYSSGFIAKDDNHIWKYDDDSLVLEELDDIDAESFDQIGDYPIFKDNDHVYIPNGKTLEAIDNADPATFELKVFRGEYYFADKDTVWGMDDSEDGFSEIDNVDPDAFFDRELDEDSNYIVVTETDFGISGDIYPAVLVDLETEEVSLFSDWMTWMTEEDDVLQLGNDLNDLLESALLQSEYDLWIEPGDPEIASISSQIATVEVQYDEINVTDVEKAEFYDHSSFNYDEVSEGLTFLVKTRQDSVYKIKLLEFYSNTHEMVLEYSLVE